MWQFRFHTNTRTQNDGSGQEGGRDAPFGHFRTGAQQFHHWTRSQVSLPTRLAIMTGVLAIGVPLFLLAMAAVMMGAIVFIATSLILQSVQFVKSFFSNMGSKRDEDGRRNVTVLRD